DRVYDGFLLHGRAPYAMPVEANRLGAVNPPFRPDLNVPLISVQSEMEVTVSWPLSKTPDTDKVRHWEVAGAVHFGSHLQDDIHAVASPDYGGHWTTCLRPMNSLPLHVVDQAALHALRLWVTQGTPPPRAPRLLRNSLGFVRHDDD